MQAPLPRRGAPRGATPSTHSCPSRRYPPRAAASALQSRAQTRQSLRAAGERRGGRRGRRGERGGPRRACHGAARRAPIVPEWLSSISAMMSNNSSSVGFCPIASSTSFSSQTSTAGAGACAMGAGRGGRAGFGRPRPRCARAPTRRSPRANALQPERSLSKERNASRHASSSSCSRRILRGGAARAARGVTRRRARGGCATPRVRCQ